MKQTDDAQSEYLQGISDVPYSVININDSEYISFIQCTFNSIDVRMSTADNGTDYENERRFRVISVETVFSQTSVFISDSFVYNLNLANG